MHSKIKVLFLISTLIFITSACNKEDLDINNTSTPTIVPVQTEKPIPSNNPSNDTVINKFSDIGLFEGKWLSQNQTELVYDSSEGWAIEETIPDYSCTLIIRETEDDKVEVYINFTSDLKKTLRDTFIVVFDKNGRTQINNVSKQIISIDIDLKNKGYLIHTSFNFGDEKKVINFVSDEMLGKINNCMKIIRNKLGLELNRGIVDGEDVIVSFSSIDDSGILINVIRAEDTVVRGRYLFDIATLEYDSDKYPPEVLITSPQKGRSQYDTNESNINISGAFTNKDIHKISYSVFYEGEEVEDSSYPAITKGTYNKETGTTDWLIENFPVKYLCTTVEIYVTDKSGKQYMGWIDIVEDGDDDNDGLSNYLENLNETDPNNPDTDSDGLTDWEEVYIYGTDPIKYDTDSDGISDGDEVLHVYYRNIGSEGNVYFIKEVRSELEPDIASALRVVYKDDSYVPFDLDLTKEADRDYYRYYYENIPRRYTILDPLNHDTDGDGLPDGFEFYSTLTNPSAYDTYYDDISDADRDPDDDGLTNKQEYIYGTDPLYHDTDGDRISDADELSEEIGTNPLMRDSDNDGTDDLAELMRGTDPNDPDNGGINDITAMVEQPLDYRNVEHLNDGYNVAVPSITIKGTGDINETTEVNNALSNPLIKEFESMIIGYPIHIETRSKFETAEIKFRLTPEFTSKGNINNLRIFYYNKDINAIEILETEINVEDSEISAIVTHFGIYGVVDKIKYAEEMQAPETLGNTSVF